MYLPVWGNDRWGRVMVDLSGMLKRKSSGNFDRCSGSCPDRNYDEQLSSYLSRYLSLCLSRYPSRYPSWCPGRYFDGNFDGNFDGGECVYRFLGYRWVWGLAGVGGWGEV